MEERWIKLHFDNATDIPGTEASIITLADEQQTRMLTAIGETAVANAICIREHDKELTKFSCVETMFKMLKSHGQVDCELHITEIECMHYKVCIYDKVTDMKFPVKFADGILIAVVTNSPIMIKEDLMKKKAAKYRKDNKHFVAPINEISKDLLNKNLEQAISDEDYEKAAIIKKELDRRNNEIE